MKYFQFPVGLFGMYTIVVYITLTYKVYRFKIKFEKKVEEKKVQHTLKLQQSFDEKVDEIDGKKNVSHGFSSVFVRSNFHQLRIHL